MKGLFWLLLLVNLVLFAFVQWGGMLTGEGKNMSSRPPLNAEKIKLLEVSPAALATVPPLSAMSSATQVQAANAAVCLEWGKFSGTDLVRASAALASLNLGNKLAQRQVEYNSGYWVYIPPAKTRAAVDKKIVELKALGVGDYFIVQEPGKWHNAISLGVFKTGEAAHKFLDSLKEKGVKTAVVRERQSKLRVSVFVLRNMDATVVAKVAALHREFAGSEMRSLVCDQEPAGLTSGG